MVHGNRMITLKRRAPMIRAQGQRQLTVAEFDWSFQTSLDKNTRWVKLIFDLIKRQKTGPFTAEALQELLHHGLLPGILEVAQSALITGRCLIGQNIKPTEN